MTRPLHAHHPNVRVEVDGHVVTVTLDNAAAKNACDGDMWVAIGATFRDIAFSGARAVVLTGANEAFCAGADLSGLAGGGSGGGGGGGGGDRTDDGGPPDTMVAAMRVLAGSVLAIHECPVPVIAKVDGLCVGAGLGLALSADLLWCSDRARFSAIFAKRGLSLDFGSSWLLRQRIGVHKAKELCFTGRMVPAPEALALGLVNDVVPADELDATVAELVATIAGGPPVALSMTKRQLDNAPATSLAQALEVEALAQSVNVRTSDMREALIAYVERRPPTFHGR